MPTGTMFDSVATLSESVPAGTDPLGRPIRAHAPDRQVPCRISRPTASDLESGRDGKHVVEAVLFFPADVRIAESDRLEVNGKVAQLVAPAVDVSAPTGVAYVRAPVRWVRDVT